MFSHDHNSSDYQLFFRTRGALRPVGLNGLVLVVFVSDLMAWWLAREESGYRTQAPMLILMAILAIVLFICPEVARLLICGPLRHGISLWSPMVAILLMAPTLASSGDFLRIYLVLLVSVLLPIISRLRFPIIIKLLDSALGRKLVPWRRVILSSCMFAAMVILLVKRASDYVLELLAFEVSLLLMVSFGNLQFPAAVLRVVLALLRLIQDGYKNDADSGTKNLAPDADSGTKNLAPSLGIFYWMVLGQGILYIVACILEAFSFFLRRSLVRCAAFRGHMRVEYVNFYYAYAFEKCMGGALFAQKKISLVTFAMDSLKLDSPKMQLYGLRMLHSLLKKEPFRSKAISKLNTSTETMASLFNMLGRTSQEDIYIRSFAAKVMAELAGSLRVAPIPGAMQLIASLLGTVHQLEIKDPLLDTDIQEAKQDVPIQHVSRDRHNSPMLKWWKQMALYCLIPMEEPPNMQEHNSCICRCWKKVTKCCYILEEELAEEEPLTEQDLAVLGMSILDRLGSFDLENCIEISRASGLISKIIEFTGNKNNVTNIDEAHQTLLKASSLKVLRRLASTKGKFGVTLRQKISEHHFLLSNLAEILDDSRSCREHRELAVEILKNLALDGNMREEIGHIQGIISRLIDAFLNRDASSSTDSDHMLRMIAGQALAVLAMGSANNCVAMLAEPRHFIIKELTIMIHDDRFRYIAASLLWNMCVHARSKLINYDLKELSNILREVLTRIMFAEGAELEVLVGLSSKICNVIPEDFAQELEYGGKKEPFIQRLVDALNANMIPTAHCPGIRRVIVEQVICMMECNSSYANSFNKWRLMEALLMVERTPSRAENYRFFSGDAGLMEHNIPLSALVAKAKELIYGS